MHNKEKISVSWSNNERYSFMGELLTRDNAGKGVYRGFFEGEAPVGLKPRTEYILKKIDKVTDSIYPQSREFYDMFSFEGQHLRTILAKSAAAELVCNSLNNGKSLTDDCIRNQPCYWVEPAYFPLTELLEKASTLSACQKLDLVYQLALGSRELSQNTLWGRPVAAHRDMKIANGVYRKTDQGYQVFLIDFASVYRDKDADDNFQINLPLLRNSHAMVMSPDNTAPELVLRDSKDFPISDKTDVYALGMILATFFSTTKKGRWSPSDGIFRQIEPHAENHPERLPALMANAFKMYLDKYDQDDTGFESWAEKAIESKDWKIHWDDIGDEKLLSDIRKVYKAATRILPKKRMSRDKFIAELETLKARCEVPAVRETPKKAKKVPVSIYLFDQKSMANCRQAYMVAAKQLFNAAHTANGTCALCVSYGNDASSARVLGNPLCTDSNTLIQLIKGIPHQDAPGQKKSYLSYGLHLAYAQISQLCQSKGYSFTGQIYLFTPTVLHQDDLLPVYDRAANMQYSVDALCSEDALGYYCDEGPYLKAYAFRMSPSAAEDYPWCEFHDLSKYYPSQLANLKQAEVDKQGDARVAGKSPKTEPQPQNRPYVMVKGKKFTSNNIERMIKMPQTRIDTALISRRAMLELKIETLAPLFTKFIAGGFVFFFACWLFVFFLEPEMGTFSPIIDFLTTAGEGVRNAIEGFCTTPMLSMCFVIACCLPFLICWLIALCIYIHIAVLNRKLKQLEKQMPHPHDPNTSKTKLTAKLNKCWGLLIAISPPWFVFSALCPLIDLFLDPYSATFLPFVDFFTITGTGIRDFAEGFCTTPLRSQLFEAGVWLPFYISLGIGCVLIIYTQVLEHKLAKMEQGAEHDQEQGEGIEEYKYPKDALAFDPFNEDAGIRVQVETGRRETSTDTVLPWVDDEITYDHYDTQLRFVRSNGRAYRITENESLIRMNQHEPFTPCRLDPAITVIVTYLGKDV